MGNKKHLLEHEIINQVESDLNDQDFEAMSEMLQKLIEIKEARIILINYLSDSGKENWLEGRTVPRY